MVVPNRGRGEGKSVEDLGSRDLMHDKDKSAAAILVWPFVEPLRSEQGVLCGLHAMFAPEWLDDWPDEDRRSRLVFVVHEIPRAEVLDAFAFAAPSIRRAPS